MKGPGPLQTYRDPSVWQEAVNLVKHVYCATKSLPSDERFGLCSQMQRAAVSVPANIDEGYGREHRKEHLRHLSFARASLMELETHIIISKRLRYFTEQEHASLWKQAQVVGRLLHGLIQSLGGRLRTSEPRTQYPEPRAPQSGIRFRFPPGEDLQDG